MSNKVVWAVVIVLVLVGLYYWSQPAAEVSPALEEAVPAAPAAVVDGVDAVVVGEPAAEVPADVPPVPVE